MCVFNLVIVEVVLWINCSLRNPPEDLKSSLLTLSFELEQAESHNIRRKCV